MGILKANKKNIESTNALVDAEAKARAEKINHFGEMFLEEATKQDLTVNDLQVVLNTLTQQLNVVFLSRKVSDFTNKEEVKP